jgi:rubrerythrin
MERRTLAEDQLNELILQSLEHEKGGVLIYQTALKCVVNEDLEQEWKKYLDETTKHVEVLTQVCKEIGLDPNATTPGTKIVKHTGEALVRAMEMALQEGKPEAAEIVACECVVLAETKDHADWELLSKCAERATGILGTALKEATEEIEDQEDEHLYHTKGWCRELWLQSLGLKAMLPPPEERKQVKTAIGAARAEQASERNR